MASDAPMVAIRDVSATRHGSAFELRIPALDVAAGEFVALTGPSGSGKSTLLDVTAGLLPFQRGTVAVAGLDLRQRRSRTQIRRVGAYLAQQGTVVDHLSAVENLDLSAAIAGISPDARRMSDALDQMGLGEFRARRADQLSGGQRQRIALAAALYRRSPIVWADEPTSALDDDNTRLVFTALKELSVTHGTTVLCVTHDVAEVVGWADRVLHISDGTLAEVG